LSLSLLSQTPAIPPEGGVVRILDIENILRTYIPNYDQDLLYRGYVYSARVHQGQKRVSGEPYLTHPLWVAYILTFLKADLPTVVAGLLHDTLEDTWATKEDLEENFGSEIVSLVEGVTHLGQIRYTSRLSQKAENIRKLMVAIARDVRVILLKLADRLHNIRTIHYLPPQKQEEISQETLDIFAPLASHLGIYWLKGELEDRSFKILNPNEYERIYTFLEKDELFNESFIQSILEELNKTLKEVRIPGEIFFRRKNIYSIYRKMEKNQIPLEQVYDRVGFRIVVNTIPECYMVLGAIHQKFTPVPGRFKDYIAVPKTNGYQSLHTTVIGLTGKPLEIQIRTREMHQRAEYGLAAHWVYKEGGKLDPKHFQLFTWLRQIYEAQKEFSHPDEFLEVLKREIFSEEIYVFTPKGDVVVLPQEATALDFAFKIHTDVGYHARGARINGKLVPLKTLLQNGDIVEIVTHPSQEPTPQWLKFVKTSSARSKIRSYLNRKEKEKAQETGEKILKEIYHSLKIPTEKWEEQKETQKLIKSLGIGDIPSLLKEIGYGRITPVRIEKILKGEKKGVMDVLRRFLPRPPQEPLRLLVGGEEGIEVVYARCCNPIPGDEVVGVARAGKGIRIHRVHCPSLKDINPERKVEVKWVREGEGEKTFQARFHLVVKDRPGILSKVSGEISALKINIHSVHIEPRGEGKAEGKLILEVKNAEEIQKVLERLKKVEGILSIKRV
jgi:GTP pyrophosphokinase